MKRRTKQLHALAGGIALVVLAWPGPSSADESTSLGGYSGIAQAEAVRIQIFDPTIPIPSSPQVDGGIGYTKSAADTGPVTRGTASYLWPGDVLGDGFGALSGNDKAQYAIQVNSRYPATASSPEHNTAQLTEGNGMTTYTDGFTTTATCTGLGISGPNTDLLSGIGQGLRSLPGMPHPSTSPKPLPAVPLPVSQTLAALATVQNVKSESSVVIGDKTVTSTATSYMSEVQLLAGLITIDGLKITTTTVSDGVKATTSGNVFATAVKFGKQDLGLGGQGVAIGSTDVTAPSVPKSVADLLNQVGISFSFAPVTRSIDGATGSMKADGLVVSIDTVPLKTALNLGGIVAPLQDAIGKIPKIGSQIAPLLGLGPKIVFLIGDANSQATAAPAFTTSFTPPPGGGGSTVPGGGVSSGGGGVPGGTFPTSNPSGQPTGTSTNPTTPTPAAFTFPGLGTIPKMVILGALLAALAGGWFYWAVGRFILAGGRTCAYGLTTGVPDLRKG